MRTEDEHNRDHPGDRAERGAPDGTLLHMHGVDMHFKTGVHAVDSVDLAVRRGEFVSVVGPSGCGKSTLLRIAAGLETRTGGRMDVSTDAIGYVFQDPTLLPWRTVMGNVELCTQLQHQQGGAPEEGPGGDRDGRAQGF